MPAFDKIVVVTKKTALEELVERFNTRDQARFYIEKMGADFSDYEAAHETYRLAVETLRKALPDTVRSQWIDRRFLPTFTFGRKDLVVTLGQDGLVVNAAKYLDGQPLLAFNPDPSRIDGVLIPFEVGRAGRVLSRVVESPPEPRRITMAVAALNDGRSLLAVNDLFIGAKTHVSARYVLSHDGREEPQSSSGILVSTGAGSTGWLLAAQCGAVGVLEDWMVDADGVDPRRDSVFDAESESLVYHVREPFPSRTSSAGMVRGEVTRDAPLTIASKMPQNGVIFSDGVEEDFLDFNSGAIAEVGISDSKLMLIDDRR